MSEKKKGKVLSGLKMKFYQLVFLRRHISKEMLAPDDMKVRKYFVYEFLVPLLKEHDTKVAKIRDTYALRDEEGNYKFKDNGDIDYGEDSTKSFDEYYELMNEDIFLPIDNEDVLRQVKKIWVTTSQKLQEDEAKVYLEVAEALQI